MHGSFWRNVNSAYSDFRRHRCPRYILVLVEYRNYFCCLWASGLAKLKENLAAAAIDAASASEAWKKEHEFWGKTVDTRYGSVTKEAQHFSLKQWASSLLNERDEVRAQLAVAMPEEKPIIESELELLERDVIAKSPERILRDLQMRWSERETKQQRALQVTPLLCFLQLVLMILGCFIQAEKRLQVCSSAFLAWGVSL